MVAKNYKTLKLDPKYIPKRNEPYMCPEQKAYFYQLLRERRAEILSRMPDILNNILLSEQMNAVGVGDDLDNSNFQQEANEKIKMNTRTNNLLKQIDHALARLESGTYGYSTISGNEIGLKRLMARPTATMTIEEREEYETHS
jgi:DnaK suppressor protein